MLHFTNVLGISWTFNLEPASELFATNFTLIGGNTPTLKSYSLKTPENTWAGYISLQEGIPRGRVLVRIQKVKVGHMQDVYHCE